MNSRSADSTGDDLREVASESNGDKFAAEDLADLRGELQQAGLDSWQAGELITAFLIARGYGVSTGDARHAATRIESRSCSIECMQQELGRLALVM